MFRINYVYTNKSKIILYLMIVALLLIRATVVFQIKIYQLEGYEVYLLPTLLYNLVLFAIITAVFFGYKFFFTEYNTDTVTYHNVLFNRSRSINLNQVRHIRFGKTGVHLYRCAAPKKKEKADLFIPFFRLGIIDAISINRFFETLIACPDFTVEKTFKVLPGYSKPWTLVSMLYALLAFCFLIICMEPLYTVIVLFHSFS